jgi:glycosyltransferase involved in cell wall biosynthesis
MLPNGVDTDFFNPSIKVKEVVDKYGLEGKAVVLYVGRLAKIKGVEYLLKAADIILNGFKYEDTLFMLVGSDTYAGVDKPINMEEMLQYIRTHQLDKKILLTGSLPLKEVRLLYAAADIFALPSLGEGDPLVAVEAMASGKPVIGTKVGGIVHHIRDGWNERGWARTPGDTPKKSLTGAR